MSRRRPRLTETQEQANSPVEAGGSDMRPEPAAAAAARSRGRPAAKVRKIAATPTVDDDHTGQDTTKSKGVARVPRRRGKLRQMLDMPLEIIMEICAHLQLRDILYVSRLSKAFHAFFTRRNVQFLWKSAALNVPDLPPCPQDLNEISYARLLFDAFCYDCNGKSCSSIYWGPRVRLCKRCYQLHYRARWPLGYTDLHRDDVVATELLHDHYPELNALLPTMKRCDNEIPVHYQPHLDTLVQAWKALPQDNLDVRREEFMAEHKRSTAAILETVPALESWYQDSRMTRHDELSRIRQERRAAIIEHLKGDGWQLEIDYLDESWRHLVGFTNFPGVHKPQVLTPRIWSSLKGPLTKYMKKVRKDRLHNIEVGKLKARLVVLDEAIQEILSEMVAYNTTSYECEMRIPELSDLVDLKKDFDLENSRPALRNLIQDYLQKQDQIVLQELSTALRREFDLDDSVNPFSLAVGSYFHCYFCGCTFKRQQAVRHICRSHAVYSPVKPEWASDVYFDAVVSCLPVEYQLLGPQIMWSVDNFQPAFAHVASVIEACSFDFKTATVTDLDADTNLRLTCLNHKHPADVPIMTWKTAAFHQTLCCRGPSSYRDSPVPIYGRTTEEQVCAMQGSGAITKAAEENHVYRDGYYEYTCAYCSGQPLLPGRNEAIHHASEVHEIQHPTEEDWVMIRTDEIIPGLVYVVAN